MPGGSFDLFFQGMGNRPGKGKRKHANAAAAEAQPSVHLGPRVKEAAAASRKEFSQAKITRALSLRPGGDSISQLLPLYYEVDWSDAGKLGSGHFATVYRGRNRATGQLVAMKKIKRELTRLSNLQTEVSALRKVTGHPNIVQLYDVYYNSDSVVLVLEMLGGGELFDRICDSGAYTEWDAANHCRKIATALAYMHANGIVHRDLKPENLVLADRRPNSEIKISDFGLSKILNDDEQTMKTVCGTRAYSAPEVNFGGGPRSAQYTEKVDSWSLGVILFVILVAYHPFDPYGNGTDAAIWDRICRGQWSFDDKAWDLVSEDAKDLIRRLLTVDPTKRPSAQEVLQHPWITENHGGSIRSRNNLLKLQGQSLRDIGTASRPVNNMDFDVV